MAQQGCERHFIVGCFECAGEEVLQEGVERMRANYAADSRPSDNDAEEADDEST